MLHLSDFFFPSNIYCMACGNLIDNSRPYSLCDKCIKDINWITENACKVCGRALGPDGKRGAVCFECMGAKHNFVKGFSCAIYEGPIKEVLSGLKYKGRSYYAAKIVEIMRDRAEGFIDELNIDLIIPVPMYRKKEKARGYNQSSLLASGLGKCFGIEFDDTILIKIRNTSPMSSLDRTERRINLHNAFDIGYNKGDLLTGKNILLIDDVYTTGSTADACGEVLNDNGVSAVYIYTFTSGVNMRPKFDE